MKKNVRLTPAEWEVMEAVWTLGKSPSVRDVLEHAFPNNEKAYTTVQTVMNTLEKKGLLKRKKIGLVNFYTPTKNRDTMVQVETKHMLHRMFNDSIPAMANHLIDTSSLTLKEIQEIKNLLEQKEADLKGESS